MKVASLLFVALLSACASQTIEPSYYLLRSDQDLQSSKLQPSKDFSLGKVAIAPYLDQPGLVMETEGGQMRPAQQNLWAEPIYDGVRNFLATEIGQSMGRALLPAELIHATTVIDVRIDQLHGTLDGTAHIVAYWWLVREGEVVALNRYSESRTLNENGYSALVEAEKSLLAELAAKIAVSLVATDS